MQLPYFYIDPSKGDSSIIELDEANSRHIIQVLRMRVGERINLTDGQGNVMKAEIKEENKKHCKVTIIDKKYQPRKGSTVTIAISLLKNTARFEWFLEKATEIGVTRILPLICERTEKQKFRMERMKGILISAMLQSEQCWMPELPDPLKFEALPQWKQEMNMIAHCLDKGDKNLLSASANSQLIAIGPEGDFSPRELDLALENGFTPVSLGAHRLRSETAGMVAAAILCHRV